MRQYVNAFTRNRLEKARFYSLVKTKNNIMITENHNTYCTCSLLICVSEGFFSNHCIDLLEKAEIISKTWFIFS